MAWKRSPQKGRGRRRWAFPTKAPHHWSFLLALLLAVIGIVSTRVPIDGVSAHASGLILAAYVVLALACLVRGL